MATAVATLTEVMTALISVAASHPFSFLQTITGGAGCRGPYRHPPLCVFNFSFPQGLRFDLKKKKKKRQGTYMPCPYQLRARFVGLWLQ